MSWGTAPFCGQHKSNSIKNIISIIIIIIIIILLKRVALPYWAVQEQKFVQRAEESMLVC